MLLPMDTQSSHYLLLRRLFFPHYMALATCPASQDYRCSLFQNSQFHSIGLNVYHYTSITLYLLQQLHSKFLKSGIVRLPTLFFFFRIILVNLGSSQFHVNFRIYFSTSIELAIGNFSMDCMKSIDHWVVLTSQ